MTDTNKPAEQALPADELDMTALEGIAGGRAMMVSDDGGTGWANNPGPPPPAPEPAPTPPVHTASLHPVGHGEPGSLQQFLTGHNSAGVKHP